jgi:uncharacterized protein YcfL
MNKLVVALSASALLLTGCSSNSSSEPKYDEVELIQYHACLDKYSSSSKYMFNPAVDVETAMEFCKDLLPVKK